MDVLRQEVVRLKSELSKCNSPICFCHNDLLSANVIYNEENGEELVVCVLCVCVCGGGGG